MRRAASLHSAEHVTWFNYSTDIMLNGRNSFTVINNHHTQIGQVASSLHPDFDVYMEDSRLSHIIFIKPTVPAGQDLDILASNLLI
jgi:hypothetical protein